MPPAFPAVRPAVSSTPDASSQAFRSPTIDAAWQAASGRPLADLLRWPADVFAFTSVILERSEAYRFVVSPPAGRQWDAHRNEWGLAVAAAARQWAADFGAGSDTLPDLVKREWHVVRRSAGTSLEAVASGEAWRLCEALLTLHAVADEACAPLPPAAGSGENGHDSGAVLAARARELLVRTGSMARIDPARLRVLPKYRTPPGGISARSISRHVHLAGPAVEVAVHQVAAHRDAALQDQLNLLLLPWPLHVTSDDFRPVPGSVRERPVEPFGYFEFSPSEPFDASLADRVLARATAQAGRVDIVLLPESSLSEDDLPQLEAVLSRHGVGMLVAGLRAGSGGRAFGSNWVQFATSFDGRWYHQRQDKHHRWSLDRSQIEQYHLEEVLDERVRWWESMEVPRRSIQLLEAGTGHTVAALVCEDLAQIDDVTNLLRSIGPTLVFAPLLDGPQLASRWTARYAGMLADDPGTAVLTLSAYGMVRRSWRTGQAPSTTVALWRDANHATVEITLDPEAQGVLLRADRENTIRRSADGRLAEQDVIDLSLASVTQIRVDEAPAVSAVHGALADEAGGAAQEDPASGTAIPDGFTPADLTVYLGWADALERARANSPEQVDTVIAQIGSDAAWRAGLGLPPPVGPLRRAFDVLASEGRGVVANTGTERS